MVASSEAVEPLPADTEARLAEFTELLATAIAITEARADVQRLAEEQAALRRVATLVARALDPTEVFAVVAREVGQLLGVDAAHIGRYEPDDAVICVGSWSRVGDHLPVGTRASLDGTSVSSLVLRTARPARLDSYDGAPGSIADRLWRDLHIRPSVGAPIVVERGTWGVIVASSKADQPLPVDAEARLAAFTELVATAISNAQARFEVGRLADEQTALRRVATLVARQPSSSEVFGAVAEEVGRLLPVEDTAMLRYEDDGSATVVAAWGKRGDALKLGTRMPVDEESVTARVRRTGRPARIDDYRTASGAFGEHMHKLGTRSAVGCPILVDGRLWGVMVAAQGVTEPLPDGTEARLGNFTELVATAISNAQARDEGGRLAHEQAGLRRVATLVAQQRPPAEVFATVAEELARVLGVEHSKMYRYEPDATATVVAEWGDHDPAVTVGTRLSLEGENVPARVLRTGRPARIDDYAKPTGPIGAHARRLGVRSSVGAPIVVEGRLWGAMTAASMKPEPLAADTEARIGEFTELVATAVSNMEARTDLAASRARIVAASDDERRRVVRDLHDGAQQRLVHTVITLKLAHRALQRRDGDAGSLLTEALEQAERATAELRELSHGILPAILTRGGLRAGVEALASRMPVPVAIDISVGRLPTMVEATAYFVVAEALTNVAKHAHAQRAEVSARVEGSSLHVQIRDDGVGGAQPDGSGLLGLDDRLAVLDGRLRIDSPAGRGTLVASVIPLSATDPRVSPP